MTFECIAAMCLSGVITPNKFKKFENLDDRSNGEVGLLYLILRQRFLGEGMKFNHQSRNRIYRARARTVAIAVNFGPAKKGLFFLFFLVTFLLFFMLRAQAGGTGPGPSGPAAPPPAPTPVSTAAPPPPPTATTPTTGGVSTAPDTPGTGDLTGAPITIGQGDSYNSAADNAFKASQKAASAGILLTLQGLNSLDGNKAKAGAYFINGANQLANAEQLNQLGNQNSKNKDTMKSGTGIYEVKELSPDEKMLSSSKANQIFNKFEGKYGDGHDGIVNTILNSKADPSALEQSLKLKEGAIVDAISAAGGKGDSLNSLLDDKKTQEMIAALEKEAATVLKKEGEESGSGETAVGGGALPGEFADGQGEGSGLLGRTLASRADGKNGRLNLLDTETYSGREFNPDLDLFMRVRKKYDNIEPEISRVKK